MIIPDILGKKVIVPNGSIMFLWKIQANGLCSCVIDLNNPTPEWIFHLKDLEISE